MITCYFSSPILIYRSSTVKVIPCCLDDCDVEFFNALIFLSFSPSLPFWLLILSYSSGASMELTVWLDLLCFYFNSLIHENNFTQLWFGIRQGWSLEEMIAYKREKRKRIWSHDTEYLLVLPADQNLCKKDTSSFPKICSFCRKFQWSAVFKNELIANLL